MRSRSVSLVLTLTFVALAAIAFAADAHVGTWKLNAAKSKFSAGAPMNNTVVIEAMGDNLKVTVDGTNNGKPTHNVWTGKFDGKDYPVTGDPDADTRSYTRVDDHTLTLTTKKTGKVTVEGRIVVAADGKTRTVATHGTNPQGEKIRTTAVYEKQ